MSRVMVWAPEVPPGLHPLVDMDSILTFASPVITRYPLVGHTHRDLVLHAIFMQCIVLGVAVHYTDQEDLPH